MTRGVDWLRPGIHDDVPMADYQLDPCKTPSLSSGIAKLLLTHSPLHAWTRHPALNPQAKRIDEAKFDIGTAAHELLLKGDDIMHIVDANDWRTNAAKDERDRARKEGLVPLLAKDAERVVAMVDVVREQLVGMDVDPPLLSDGKAEQTLIWEDQGVLCRGRLDWLRTDFAAIDDAKTSGITANPYEWCRTTLWNIGADLQVAMYSRAAKILTGIEPAFRYLVIENELPYAVSVVSLGPEALALANAKLDKALQLWKHCLAADVWPGYPTQVAYAELPPWVESRWMERQALTEMSEVTA